MELKTFVLSLLCLVNLTFLLCFKIVEILDILQYIFSNLACLFSSSKCLKIKLPETFQTLPFSAFAPQCPPCTHPLLGFLWFCSMPEKAPSAHSLEETGALWAFTDSNLKAGELN